jgi:periplasmic divalent cation tolerance protein
MPEELEQLNHVNSNTMLDYSDIILVLVTASDQSEAENIGLELVNKNLAACVNIISGVTSIYRWKSKVQTDSEVILLVKTRRELFNKLKRSIVSLHSNELPEIVAINITDGLTEYLKWIIKETTI